MKPFIHKKTGNVYHVIRQVTNATNASAGQAMTLYTREGDYYVRSTEEFNQKFKEITLAAGDLVLANGGIVRVGSISENGTATLDNAIGHNKFLVDALLDPCRKIAVGATVRVRDGDSGKVISMYEGYTHHVILDTASGDIKVLPNQITAVLSYRHSEQDDSHVEQEAANETVHPY